MAGQVHTWRRALAWNSKYWDIISNLYWTPRYLGLRSISRDKWRTDGDWVSVPKELVINGSGPLYVRSRKFDELKAYLHGQEEILNQLFNILFSIAGDAVISRLLCTPLGLVDNGPFESLGREIGSRYCWRDSENITQQDGLFVSPTSVIGVELKLDSTSWPEQIAKYVALMMWEEAFSHRREDLGLLFIVPEGARSAHWANVGLKEAAIDGGFASQFNPSRLPKKIQSLFQDRPDQVRAVLQRLRLAVITLTDFRERLSEIEKELDLKQAGDQTLQRLLAGFRDQLERHQKTGLNGASVAAEFVSVINGKVSDAHLDGEIISGGGKRR
jgi:hypothetical protein